MVKKRFLLAIASIVWIVAGFNVLKIGLDTYSKYVSFLNVLLSFFIFGVFWNFVFYKLVIKHTQRIKNLSPSKQYFWKFFDVKSFIIMFVMITGGLSIREFHLLPEYFIAIFYSGLGSSLLLAGLFFGYNYLKK